MLVEEKITIQTDKKKINCFIIFATGMRLSSKGKTGDGGSAFFKWGN